jgi:hypothetical protein
VIGDRVVHYRYQVDGCPLGISVAIKGYNRNDFLLGSVSDGRDHFRHHVAVVVMFSK